MDIKEIKKEFKKKYGMPEFAGKYIKHATETDEIFEFIEEKLKQKEEPFELETVSLTKLRKTKEYKFGFEEGKEEGHEEFKRRTIEVLKEAQKLETANDRVEVVDVKIKKVKGRLII